ncbi:ribosome-associated translation inhibitor RaiA [uncultured Sphingomonas sp.]|jgi:ribosomal subunit interface protein|uniref:ribosome hibernation-promoting factor, HPF/YfiA family n=1 Tax=uncultured Sphingomonas sp. TaxID=158754 RepID=UPI002618F2BE|nr:ribosome-associated translation inhibitor RaiA [uncultured Sphingomonas sp.]
MDIRVSGHQVDTGDALREHVSDRLGGIAEKYFARAISANVTFGTAPHGAFSCDIISNVMKGVVLKASGSGQEAHPAFDEAAAKIEKQLRRYMKRLRSHNGNGHAAEVDGGVDANAGYTVFNAGGDEEEVPDAPLIIAETRVDVPDATVSDAVMMLDLRNTGALLFKNAGTGAFNMVYRRADGTIGWVEPNRAG